MILEKYFTSINSHFLDMLHWFQYKLSSTYLKKIQLTIKISLFQTNNNNQSNIIQVPKLYKLINFKFCLHFHLIMSVNLITWLQNLSYQRMEFVCHDTVPPSKKNSTFLLQGHYGRCIRQRQCVPIALLKLQHLGLSSLCSGWLYMPILKTS